MRRFNPKVDTAGMDGPGPLEDLVAASLAGDGAARDALARWCLPRVRRAVLLSCGDVPEADDLVQGVMFNVIGKLHTYRGDAPFRVWLDRVTVNVIRGHFRRQSWLKLKLWEYRTESGVVGKPRPLRPDEVAESSEAIGLLAEHLARVKPSQRLPLVLNLVHGYTAREIASLLGIGHEAAKKRLLRGRRLLLRNLQRDPAFLALSGRRQR